MVGKGRKESERREGRGVEVIGGEERSVGVERGGEVIEGNEGGGGEEGKGKVIGGK